MFRPLVGVLLCTVASVVTITAQPGRGPQFYDDDPLATEPISQDVTTAAAYEPDLIYQSLESLFGKPGDPVPGQRAKNVNTIDEVPDGAFFVNRAGRVPLTPEMVRRAANTTEGPPPVPWTIVSAKSDGITPGFTIRDAQQRLWFVKFDPPGWRGMATGTEITVAKLFWALGYHTMEYQIGQLRASDLTIGPGTLITPPDGEARAMHADDIDRLLARANPDPDGTYRVILSKGAPGRPVGRLSFHGTRSDDPNDVVPHEHRRELRGYGVFAAWLNHVDAKGINSLSALVSENGRSYVKHFLLDFGSALGSAAIGPREDWEGYEALAEPFGEVGKRALSLGARIPNWRLIDMYESPAIGRLPRDHSTWDPTRWEPHITNAAFRHARADDRFWAARTMTAITEPLIRAAVAAGQFGNPDAEAFLVKAIVERRQRILDTYLPAVNPIVDPMLTAGGLTFRNAAVEARAANAPSGYRAAWAVFDNATGLSRPIATTESATSQVAAPTLPADGFVEVKVSAVGGPAAWAEPVTLHFRRSDGGWRLVGLQRMP